MQRRWWFSWWPDWRDPGGIVFNGCLLLLSALTGAHLGRWL